jgi:hypothetical protein
VWKHKIQYFVVKHVKKIAFLRSRGEKSWNFVLKSGLAGERGSKWCCRPRGRAEGAVKRIL